MKRVKSFIALLLVLCTVAGMFSMLAPMASAATVKVSISDIMVGGKKFADYIEKNKKMPGSVDCNGTKVTCQQFLYLATKAVVMLNNGKAKTTKISAKDFGKCSSPSETLSGTFDMMKSEYIQRAKNIYTWMDSNGQVPNYATISKGTLRYENCLYIMSKILRFVKNEGIMPNYVTTKKWSVVIAQSSSSSTSSNLAKELAAAKAKYPGYLKATANCQVTNSTIKAVGKAAIGNATTLRQAAKNLVNYLNNKTAYDYYYDTHKGALKTWNSKSGNCCDMAHLVVACARSQGIPARYVHAYCSFQSGLVCGHVYAELWTGSSWEIADIVSDYNYLGYKTSKTLSVYNRYTELPF